jgi:AcrR family transcriptional regulator
MEASGKTLRIDGAETRARLKETAQRLFAERGIDGVSVQEIVSAAGQRNNASLRYYFGTKLDLARELVVDGARLLDERRQALVDELERDGQPQLRKVLEALNIPVLELSEIAGQGNYMRMVANFQLNNRAFLREALEDRWNVGYKRCVGHLMKLAPQVPLAILEQRISLAGIYGNAVWAAREAALHANVPNKLWFEAFTISNVIDTFQLLIEMPPSGETLALLQEKQRR